MRKKQREMTQEEHEFYSSFTTTITGGVAVNPDGTPKDKTVLPKGTDIRLIPLKGVIVGWDFDFYIIMDENGIKQHVHKSLVEQSDELTQ